MALPLIDVAVGGDPAAAEIGYQDLSAPDHVLGVNVASRPDGATVTPRSASESADPGTTRMVTFISVHLSV